MGSFSRKSSIKRCSASLRETANSSGYKRLISSLRFDDDSSVRSSREAFDAPSSCWLPSSVSASDSTNASMKVSLKRVTSSFAPPR